MGGSKKSSENGLVTSLAMVDWNTEWQKTRAYHSDDWVDLPSPIAQENKIKLKTLIEIAGIRYEQVWSRRNDPVFRLLTRLEGGEQRARYFVRNGPAFLAWWGGFGIGPKAVAAWRAANEGKPVSHLPEPTRTNEYTATSEGLVEKWELVKKKLEKNQELVAVQQLKKAEAEGAAHE